MLLILFCYNIGLGPVRLILLSEMFSPEDQKIVAGLCHASNYLTAAILNKAFPYLIIIFGLTGIFLSIAVTMMIGMVFTKFFIPETRTKQTPVEDIVLLSVRRLNI